MSPTTEKSHMNDISYKAYMSKTVVCHTHTMSIVFVHGHHVYVYMYRSVCSLMCTKNLVLYGWTLF